MQPARAPRANFRRRSLLLGTGAALAACTLAVRASRSGPVFSPSDETHAFEVTLDADAPGRPVNRRVLGSNVGWAFGGDGMLQADGNFAPAMLAMARQLAPTVLRYPGGTFSDVFHWESATNEHVFTRKRQPTLMDTQRFLELCEAVGAQPLISVNMVTGTAEEAARWVHATNVARMKSRITGRVLPAVRFWELGNEPYLQEQSRHDIDLAPEEYARRVNSFIPALRKVDASILIGLPLTSDMRAGIPATPYQGFTRKVLGRVGSAFDYACLHNAYMPFGFKRGMQWQDLYWGAAAGAASVQADFAHMAQLLRELRPGRRLPLAVTEYGPIFSLGQGPTDKLIASPAGAIFLADAVRMFAQTPDLLLATHWSLSGNWLFGAIHEGGHARPAFEVLRLAGEALQGELVAARVRTDSVRVNGIGQVSPREAMPLIEVLATRTRAAGRGTAPSLRLLLINKDPQRAALGVLSTTGLAVSGRPCLSVLSARDVFDAQDQPNAMTRSESTLASDAGRVHLRLPPHSVALLTMDLSSS